MNKQDIFNDIEKRIKNFQYEENDVEINLYAESPNDLIKPYKHTGKKDSFLVIFYNFVRTNCAKTVYNMKKMFFKSI